MMFFWIHLLAATAATLWTLWAFHMVVESWGIDISVATSAIDK